MQRIYSNDELSEPGIGENRKANWRNVAMIALLMIGGALTAALPLAYDKPEIAPTTTVARASDGAVLVPGIPENGVLSITIPPGTAESMAAGGRGYVLPAVIQLHRGDRIVIRNDDIFPHIMLFAFVMPGETAERSFDHVMTETYSAGCTIDPTPNGFTSLFVSA